MLNVIVIGAVHKRCPESGGRGFSSADIMRTRGVLQMRTSSLFGAKNLECFEIYGVSTRTRGVEPVRTFCEHGGSSIFRDLCGRLLWTAPYSINRNLPKYANFFLQS